MQVSRPAIRRVCWMKDHKTFFTAEFLQDTFLWFPCSLSSASLALQENLTFIRTGDIHRQALGQDAADNVKEDLKFELAVLNAAMKDLNKTWDFTVLFNPLLGNAC
jgi:hypothetical protein